MLKKAFRAIHPPAAFVAATAFFWGGAEALVNHFRPPQGTWWPDRLVVSVSGRVIFYAVVVGAATLVALGVKGLIGLIGKRAKEKRPLFWGGAGAAATVVAANAGWLTLGLIKSYTLNLSFFQWDIQKAGPFFGYWGFWLGTGVGLTVLLALTLGRRRWARAVGRYARAVGAAAFVAVLGVRWGAEALRPVPAGPNVVLIILDAWRYDTFRPDLMPHLRTYAAKNAVVFERTWTCATWTLPAVATLFTGQYPHTHITRQDPHPEKYSPTLAQAFRAAGYDTVAFSANRILDRNTNLVDGFDRFYFTDWSPALRVLHFYDTNWYGPAVRNLIHEPPTSNDTRILCRMLAAHLARPHKRPYFLWVHFMDPHGPYIPPPGYYLPEDEKYIRDYKPYARQNKEGLKRLYDGECRFMDDELAPLLPRLAGRPRTITVVTADHGEEFWEHGKYTFGHGKSVYDTLTRVPLIISVPGAPPADVETPVSSVDLAPTLLTLAGRRPLPTMEGQPLFTSGGKLRPRGGPVFIGSSFFKLGGGQPERRDAAVLWPHKLILYHSRPAAPGEFYNLAADPGEEQPLREDAVAALLRRDLSAWRLSRRRGALRAAPEGGAAPVDLRALGYIK